MLLIKALFLFVLILLSTQAKAEVKDYQVIRLIALKSECKKESLKRVYKDADSVDFEALCANVSFYPNGIKVHCADRDDERSCKIITATREFNHLKLLQAE